MSNSSWLRQIFRARTRRLGFVALILASPLALGGAASGRPVDSPAGASTQELAGMLDSASGSGRPLVNGWVATAGVGVQRVRVVVDGDRVKRTIARTSRPDVVASLGVDTALGFQVKLRRAARESVCVSLLSRGEWHGLGCTFVDPDAFNAARGGGTVVGDAGPIVRYSVEAEGRTGLHPEVVAREVDRVLADRRSWIGDGTVRFKRVEPGREDVRVLVAAPATVDRLCAPFETAGRLSCRMGTSVIMNADRWAGAVSHWTAGIGEYRSYLVNHEMGHFLGHGHESCPGPGRPAPVMQQQTKSLDGCKPNGWPFPAASSPPKLSTNRGQTTVG